MSCKECRAYEKDPLYAGFMFTCLGCCVRALKQCRPLRKVQEATLAVIERCKGAPTREEILNALRKESETCQ